MRSHVLDFVIRMQVSTSVAIFNGERLPVPRLTKGNRHFDELVIRAAILTCTTPEFDALWEEVVAEYPGVVLTRVCNDDARYPVSDHDE